MIDQSNMPGMDGFRWWTGIVEDRKDPEKLARMQIRMYVWHTDDKSLIPTEKLFWAIPIFPTNNSNQTYTAKEGDAVFGFWIDTKDFQQPYVFGRLPDKPEKLYPATKGFSDPGKWMGDRPVEVASRVMVESVGVKYSDAPPVRYPNPLKEQTDSRFARNDKLEKTPLPFVKQNIISEVDTARPVETLKKDVYWKEVQPEYAAVYPYNDSKQSESGHFIDVDDTRRKERINLMHRTGTMQEMRPSGSIHRKDLKHAISLVHGSDFKNVRGNIWHTVERWTRFRSKGKIIVEGNQDADISIAGNLTITAGSENGQTGTITIQGKRIVFIAEEEILMKTLTLNAGVVEANFCTVGANLFGGNFVGNLLGTASEVGNVTLPNITCQAQIITPNVEYIEDSYEAFIDEVITKGSESEDNPEETTPEDDFQKRMDDWFAKIMAPTGGGGGDGGAGQDWLYWFADGTMGGFHSHHATGNDEVLTYIWCLGAVRAQVTECSTGAVTNYSRPDNYSCPI